MKCLKPPFSAMIGSQVMCWTLRSSGFPSKSVTFTPARVTIATSPSCRKNMLRVCSSSAGTSEATKYSFSPNPITDGGPFRAATIFCGSSAEITPNENTPVSCFTVLRTASSSETRFGLLLPPGSCVLLTPDP
jgi:hypothetical protein